jgi:bifunctional UDP-N-acetylglucosamine pyrophosphorylase/glucosamine-1-phosphate N-acetyltransferase
MAVERSQQTIREGGAARYREIKTRDKKPKTP